MTVSDENLLDVMQSKDTEVLFTSKIEEMRASKVSNVEVRVQIRF